MEKKIKALKIAAQEIVNDFDIYGIVLQIGYDDKEDCYSPSSPIEQLRKALKNLED